MLYSIVVKFRPLDNIGFSYETAEVLYEFLLDIYRDRDIQKYRELSSNTSYIKPITVSSIFPNLSIKDGIKHLDSGKTYFFRVTFFDEEWFTDFMGYFVCHSKELNFNNSVIQIMDIISSPQKSKWSNFISVQDLLKRKQKEYTIKMNFHSPTLLMRDDERFLFPRPDIVFADLLNRWNVILRNDPSLHIQSIDLSKISIIRCQVNTEVRSFKNTNLKGVKGFCIYEIDKSLPLEKLTLLNNLTILAFYTGVGYKTELGFGQVKSDIYE